MAKKGNIVKRTKSDIRLLVIVLLAVSWVCVVMNLGVDKEKEEQAALIETAKVYLEDKLYIRAVNNYKTALNDYDTENNALLETELVALYLEAGMMEDYYELIEARVEKGTAAEAEYLELADMYIEEERYTKAIPILKSGIEHYENSQMIEKKEKIIYEHRVKTVNLPELKQPEKNWIVPAFDGEKWGYITNSGDVLLDFIYEEATQFCNGYAVVRLDGVYTLIDENGYWNAIDKIGLDFVTDISESAIVGIKDEKYQIYSRTFQLLSEESYDQVYLNDNGLYMVQKDGKWAILSSDMEPVTDYLFADVAVNSKGKVFSGSYAMVKDERGYCLINQDGEALYEERFADAKGFEGGLCAVADANGKWGFANDNGEIIVDFQYGDVCSFSSNLAAVEYGGFWGYINRHNKMIIEPKYVAAYPFVNNCAIAETEIGNYEILTLRYFELF